MSFDSRAYLLFLPTAILLHWLCPHRGRWAVLLAVSLFFYASWSVPLTELLLVETGAVWLAGLSLARWRRPALRRLALGLSLAVCFSLLGYFKYFNFLAGSVSALLGGTWDAWDIILPVGCSFYTFQAVSYVIDVYRGGWCRSANPAISPCTLPYSPNW